MYFKGAGPGPGLVAGIDTGGNEPSRYGAAPGEGPPPALSPRVPYGTRREAARPPNAAFSLVAKGNAEKYVKFRIGHLMRSVKLARGSLKAAGARRPGGGSAASPHVPRATPGGPGPARYRK